MYNDCKEINHSLKSFKTKRDLSIENNRKLKNIIHNYKCKSRNHVPLGNVHYYKQNCHPHTSIVLNRCTTSSILLLEIIVPYNKIVTDVHGGKFINILTPYSI